MKRIALLTFTRAEYGSIVPVFRALRASRSCDARLIAAGTHLSPWHGQTIAQIEAEEIPISARVEMQLASDSGQGVGKSVGVAMISLAQVFAQEPPDMVVIAGDRTELLGAATVALSMSIPIAHISGGEITEGAVDNQIRHAITKMSHLHFVCMAEHAARLRQMGEESWRVHVTGDPALDALAELKRLSRAELAADLGLPLDPPVTVLTYHPTTLSDRGAAQEIDAVLAGLTDMPGSVVITAPNADAGGHVILSRLEEFAGRHPRCRIYASLGTQRYYSLLAVADMMVGNSSSGIWEAPSFALPVVNIGERQRGRTRAGNVIDAIPTPDSVRAAVAAALAPGFRESIMGQPNPYGDGTAATKIARVLGENHDRRALLMKRFVDIEPAGGAESNPKRGTSTTKQESA